MGRNLHLHCGELSDVGDGEFYGLSDISNRKGYGPYGFAKDVESNECTITTYGGNTE